MSVKTRMAPSPTGEYHVGHLRTLLYNYALARQKKGKFLLRIEDTDRSRYVEGAVKDILKVIKDYGFVWDEGPEVGSSDELYVQSERLDIYKKYAEELVEKGHAYYCFCTEEYLTSLREEQLSKGQPPKYNKGCLGLSKEEKAKMIEAGEKYVIRLNIPKGENVVVEDVVYGRMEFDTSELDDQVLLKSDGFPTYHLAVVVDDHLMGVTHVLRGNDWLPSTPKHVLLYKAFGWELPVYAHLPNLKESDGTKKLSKRHGSVSAREFLEEGYLAEAMLNFLMFLGWNPGTDKEIYSLDEFVEDFSLEKVHKTDLVCFDREKLLWYNGHYIRDLSAEKLWERIKSWSGEFGVDLNVGGGDGDEETVLKIVGLVKERMKVLSEFNDLTRYFFEEPEVDEDLLVEFAGDKARDVLNGFIDLYSDVSESDWTAENLDKISHEFIKEKGYSPKEAFMTLRVAVSGVKATPPIFDTVKVIGKDSTLNRLKKATQIVS